MDRGSVPSRALSVFWKLRAGSVSADPGAPRSKYTRTYWAIKQFSFPALSCELAWCTLTSPRSSIVDMLPGGLSELCKHALKFFLGAPGGPDLRRGVAIQIPGEAAPRQIKGKLSLFIGDERGLKFSAEAKGSGAHKICGMRANIV
eukprot:5179458-Pyramimonas_sp.AAC.1